MCKYISSGAKLNRVSETSVLKQRGCDQIDLVGGAENPWGLFWHSHNCCPHFLPYISWTIGCVPPSPLSRLELGLRSSSLTYKMKLINNVVITDNERVGRVNKSHLASLYVCWNTFTRQQWRLPSDGMVITAWHAWRCFEDSLLQTSCSTAQMCCDMVPLRFPEGGEKWTDRTGLSADDVYAQQQHRYPERSFMSYCFAHCQLAMQELDTNNSLGLFWLEIAIWFAILVRIIIFQTWIRYTMKNIFDWLFVFVLLNKDFIGRGISFVGRDFSAAPQYFQIFIIYLLIFRLLLSGYCTKTSINRAVLLPAKMFSIQLFYVLTFAITAGKNKIIFPVSYLLTVCFSWLYMVPDGFIPLPKSVQIYPNVLEGVQ